MPRQRKRSSKALEGGPESEATEEPPVVATAGVLVACAA
eukprot:COSAG04_NODE_18696_length_434_cov_1.605970_1_plen_38_part_01